MIAAGILAAAHSATIPGTVSAAVTITARSIGPGTAADRGIGFPPQDGIPPWIYGIDFALERGEVGQDGPPGAGFSLCSSDDRHARRSEERIQRTAFRFRPAHDTNVVGAPSVTNVAISTFSFGGSAKV